MKGAIIATVVSLASSVCAFPAFAQDALVAEHMAIAGKVLEGRSAAAVKRQQDTLGISKAQTNCGPTPCLNFDAKDQLISVTGQNVYQSPGPGDIRGPCPGLNAAANHGYLPRNGIASIEQTISGLGALYNLSPELSAALAAYAVALDGNIVEGVWSIGGPLPADYLTGALLGTGQGISYAHNNYEGDSSIGRNDAYLANGDAHSLNITKFERVYAVGGSEDRYTLDKFRQHFQQVQQESIENNPYYFTGAFSTVVVVPAAYNFVINLMSNHTAQQPSGYLDGYNFKSFFGVSGKPGSFVWNKGQERVPENWYRRPSSNPYDAKDTFADVGITYVAYPNTLKFGGNAGKPNTFTGLNVEDLVGGVLNAETLFEGDNFACFSFNLVQQLLPDFLNNIVNDLAPVTKLINQYSGPLVNGLSCPQLGKYDVGLFDQFPGYKYRPTGPATNY